MGIWVFVEIESRLLRIDVLSTWREKGNFMTRKKVKPITFIFVVFIVLNIFLILFNSFQISRENKVEKKYLTYIDNNMLNPAEISLIDQKGIYQGTIFLLENYEKYRDYNPSTKDQILTFIEYRQFDEKFKVTALTQHYLNILVIDKIYFKPLDNMNVINIDIFLFVTLLAFLVTSRRK